MLSKEAKINTLFKFWLAISLLLVFLIIIVGGFTRLTNSGLSIVEWELFKGVLPPLNDTTWNLYFNKYKSIPQFKIINFDMSIEEFKIIFYWEYYHRMLARIIGLFFLIPLIFFYLTKRIKKEYLKICLIIFFLIIFQGIIGWYMVKSGLINNVSVSHYRLALHLSFALIIISTIFWLLKNFSEKKYKYFFIFTKNNFPYHFLIFIIFIQIIMGAFVSGLDAGMIYQTWPLMGNSYFPNDLVINEPKHLLKFSNHSLVQFYHRNFAYFIILYVIFLSIFIHTKKKENLFKPLKFLILIVFLQVTIGVATLISGLNIYLASLHQIMGVLLVFSALNLHYLNAK